MADEKLEQMRIQPVGIDGDFVDLHPRFDVQEVADVAVLKIEGIESGLQKLFGDDYQKVKALKPVGTDVSVEEFEEDDLADAEDE